MSRSISTVGLLFALCGHAMASEAPRALITSIAGNP
jgi:hypothetical protein